MRGIEAKIVILNRYPTALSLFRTFTIEGNKSACAVAMTDDDGEFVKPPAEAASTGHATSRRARSSAWDCAASADASVSPARWLPDSPMAAPGTARCPATIAGSRPGAVDAIARVPPIHVEGFQALLDARRGSAKLMLTVLAPLGRATAACQWRSERVFIRNCIESHLRLEAAFAQPCRPDET